MKRFILSGIAAYLSVWLVAISFAFVYHAGWSSPLDWEGMDRAVIHLAALAAAAGAPYALMLMDTF